MLFLVDTNILISAEPARPQDVEATTPAIAELLRALSAGGHRPFVHPASIAEISGDRNKERRDTRLVLIRKYSELPHPPGMSPRLHAALAPKAGSHNEIDALLLSAVEGNAVDYLVTNDDGIHRRARRVGLSDRVLSIADATATVLALFPSVPRSPPHVSSLYAHELETRDPIFQSFRDDYQGFDHWLAKCQREHRQCWVINRGGPYGALAIVNREDANEYGFQGKSLKICSFKIAEQFRGYRYGELLLKTVFAYADENSYESLFLETLPKQQHLVGLLEDFGFTAVRQSAKGESVMLKLQKPDAAAAALSPLEFNVRYGPHQIRLSGTDLFVVPIRPEFHDLLFPELQIQLPIAPESNSFGNSIRKAYLCHAKTRQIRAGDVVLFYRSMVASSVTAVGVVEDVLVSRDPDEIRRRVGGRTVYSDSQIRHMTSKAVLVVLFRLARSLKTSLGLDLLKRAGIIKGPPQSIVKVRQEGVAWIASQLDALR